MNPSQWHAISQVLLACRTIAAAHNQAISLNQAFHAHLWRIERSGKKWIVRYGDDYNSYMETQALEDD